MTNGHWCNRGKVGAQGDNGTDQARRAAACAHLGVRLGRDRTKMTSLRWVQNPSHPQGGGDAVEDAATPGMRGEEEALGKVWCSPGSSGERCQRTEGQNGGE